MFRVRIISFLFYSSRKMFSSRKSNVGRLSKILMLIHLLVPIGLVQNFQLRQFIDFHSEKFAEQSADMLDFASQFINLVILHFSSLIILRKSDRIESSQILATFFLLFVELFQTLNFLFSTFSRFHWFAFLLDLISFLLVVFGLVFTEILRRKIKQNQSDSTIIQFISPLN